MKKTKKNLNIVEKAYTQLCGLYPSPENFKRVLDDNNKIDKLLNNQSNTIADNNRDFMFRTILSRCYTFSKLNKNFVIKQGVMKSILENAVYKQQLDQFKFLNDFILECPIIFCEDGFGLKYFTIGMFAKKKQVEEDDVLIKGMTIVDADKIIGCVYELILIYVTSDNKVHKKSFVLNGKKHFYSLINNEKFVDQCKNNEIEFNDDYYTWYCLLMTLYSYCCSTLDKYKEYHLFSEMEYIMMSKAEGIYNCSKKVMCIEPITKDCSFYNFNDKYSFLEKGFAYFLNIGSKDNLQRTYNHFVSCLLNKNDLSIEKKNLIAQLLRPMYAEIEMMNNRVVFEYNHNISSYLTKKYKGQLNQLDTNDTIIKFLPYDNFTLMNSDSSTFINVTKRNVMVRNKGMTDLLIISQFSQDGICITTDINLEETLLNNINGAKKDILSDFSEIANDIFDEDVTKKQNDMLSNIEIALSIVCHLATIHRKKFESNMKKIPIKQKSMSKNNKEKSRIIKNDNIIHSSFRIHELTKAFYKPKKMHTEHAKGWTMSEHTRAGHYRRVWVGSKENRHLELRYIKETIVNKSNSNNVVIKEMKV